MIRRIAVLVAVALLFGGLAAAPAAADRPVNSQFSVTFPDIDPCTGELHEITINLDLIDHVGHKNNFVGRAVRTGTTDSGYVMEHGRAIVVDNGHVEASTFNDVFSNEDGRKFRAWGVFIFDISNEEVTVDRFRLQCIRD